MKIKNKIILSMVLICIISIFAIGVVNYTVSIEKLKEKLYEEIEITASNTSKDVDKWMSLEKNTLSKMANSIVHSNNFQYDYLYKYLNQEMVSNSGSEYYVALPDNTLITSSGWVPPDDYIPTERDWYKNAVTSSQLIISDPYIDAKTGDVVVTISIPLLKDGNLLGVLSCDLSTNYIVERINQVS